MRCVLLSLIKVREGLEALPVPVVPDEEVPEYVECVIKEALRRSVGLTRGLDAV